MSWNSHITVACVVEQDGRFLLVEERSGEPGEALLLNQPAGHWEDGETLQGAALRETLEESAWEVELTAVLGLYAYKPAHLEYGFLRVAFAARPLRHHAQRPLDQGIERALWLSYAELAASAARHRSPMVLRAVDDYRAGRRYPLELLSHLR